LNDELVAAAAGGGGGSHGGAGGDGGLEGSDGESNGTGSSSAAGLGATQVAGGAGGDGSDGGDDGEAGVAGQGGEGGDLADEDADAGGGGGGGMFGGGGAGAGEATVDGGGAGGGGGSSLTTVEDVDPGERDGDGKIEITLSDEDCPGDLEIQKSVSDPEPEIGDEITYTLEVTNNGPVDPDTGVVVTDPLPPQVEYLSDDCGGTNEPPWTWVIGELDFEETVECEITVEVLAPGEEIINAALVTGDNPDREPDNNEDEVPIVVPPPDYDLEIVKDADPTEVLVGENVTYSLAATNLGPDDAGATFVADVLPPQVSYVSDNCGGVLRPGVSPDPPLPPINGTLWTWAVGELDFGDEVMCEIAVKVLQPGEEITNIAGVISHGFEGGLEFENNVDEAEIKAVEPLVPPVIPPAPAPPTPPTPKKTKPKKDKQPGNARLEVRKTAKQSSVKPAGRVDYKITVVNRGPGTAKSVRICDRPPGGLRLEAAPGADVKGKQACWERGKLAPGQRWTVKLSTSAVGKPKGRKVRNRATARAGNAGTVADVAAVRVRRRPPTACPSTALRVVPAGGRGC
jgi:uncharacterized repeat protein (TIGR01451 family)